MMDNQFYKFDIKRFKPKKERRVLPIPPAPVKAKKKTTQIMSFAAAMLALILILQSALYLTSARDASGEILGVATEAYSNLDSAKKNLTEQNLQGALALFESASSNIKIAQNKLSNFKTLTFLTPQGNTADHILSGAGYLAAAGEQITSALQLFDEFKVTSSGVETSDFSEKIIANRNALIQARDLVYKSSSEFNSAKSLPLDYEQTLEQAKGQVSQLGSVLDKLIGLETLYIDIFGSNKIYFLIFQNYDEARATGGFIGTYGILKADNGKIKKLEIDSIYDLDGHINDLVAAPGPFQPEIKRWGIRDANWFADFPTSAEKILYFFEKGYGTADGVISITPKLFEDLLGLIGPIEMPEYGVTLSAENFQDVVQYKTSVDFDRELNEPKKLLADFAPILLNRLSNLSKEQWFEFFQIMQNNLNQRQVLVYSKDLQTQKTIDQLGFSGKILGTDYDYLNIINSNLGGTKTDLEIEQKVNLKSKILSDGSVVNTLSITRINPTEEKNRDFMRVLVPLGSALISSSGFDDYPIFNSEATGMRVDPDLANWDKGVEAGKKSFRGWVILEGGEEQTVTLSYMLPFRINATYSLLVQKQSGSMPYNFEGSLSMGKYKAIWATSNVTKTLNSLNFKSESNLDDFYGFVLQ